MSLDLLDVVLLSFRLFFFVRVLNRFLSLCAVCVIECVVKIGLETSL